MFRYKIGISTDSLELKGGMFTFEIGMPHGFQLTTRWFGTYKEQGQVLGNARGALVFQDPVAMTSYVV